MKNLTAQNQAHRSAPSVRRMAARIGLSLLLALPVVLVLTRYGDRPGVPRAVQYFLSPGLYAGYLLTSNSQDLGNAIATMLLLALFFNWLVYAVVIYGVLGVCQRKLTSRRSAPPRNTISADLSN